MEGSWTSMNGYCPSLTNHSSVAAAAATACGFDSYSFPSLSSPSSNSTPSTLLETSTTTTKSSIINNGKNLSSSVSSVGDGGGFMELLGGSQDFISPNPNHYHYQNNNMSDDQQLQIPSFEHSSPAPYLPPDLLLPSLAPLPLSTTNNTRDSTINTDYQNNINQNHQQHLQQPSTPNSSSISSATNNDGDQEHESHHHHDDMTNFNNNDDQNNTEAMAGLDKDDEDEEEAVVDEEQHNSSTKKQLKAKRKNQKKPREQRFAFMTKSEVDHLEDGYRWRKYGQKAVKNSPFPRSYFRCTHGGCNVKKRVERCFSDPSIVVTTYEGQHTHISPLMSCPLMPTLMSSTTTFPQRQSTTSCSPVAFPAADACSLNSNAFNIAQQAMQKKMLMMLMENHRNEDGGASGTTGASMSNRDVNVHGHHQQQQQSQLPSGAALAGYYQYWNPDQYLGSTVMSTASANTRISTSKIGVNDQLLQVQVEGKGLFACAPAAVVSADQTAAASSSSNVLIKDSKGLLQDIIPSLMRKTEE